MVAKIDTKITIITPTFNSAKNITNLLKSVSSQGYKNLEHIIIDGESTDNTLCIIKKWKSHKVILHSSRDEGVYDAMNKGLSFATGEFVGFLNSDDVFSSKNTLNTISQFLRKSGADICYGDLFYLDTKDSSKIVRRWKTGNYKFEKFRSGWLAPHPTFYVRNSLIKKHGKFDINYRLASDVDFIIRYLTAKNIEEIYIPYVLVLMKNGGISNNSYTNRIIQNLEIYKIFRKNKIKVFFLFYLIRKITSRIKQFYTNDSNFEIS
jgi:glycosyltransferase involved in cell wall biosynthesis